MKRPGIIKTYRSGRTVPFPDRAGVRLRPVREALNPLFASSNGNLYRADGVEYRYGIPYLRASAVPLEPEVRDDDSHPFARVRVRLKRDPAVPKRPSHSVAYLVARSHGLLRGRKRWRITPPADPRDCRLESITVGFGRDERTYTLGERKRRAWRMFLRRYEIAEVMQHVGHLPYPWLKRAKAAARAVLDEEWRKSAERHRAEEIDFYFQRTMGFLRGCRDDGSLTRGEYRKMKHQLVQAKAAHDAKMKQGSAHSGEERSTL